MEQEFHSFSILLTVLLCCLMALKIKKRAENDDTTSNLPPGPWKLPVIGNLHQLAGSLPHRVLRELARKYGPLMHLQLGEISNIVVSCPELAKEVMKTHDVIFASRPRDLAAKIIFYDYNDIIFSPYNDSWRQLRKICVSELLSLKRVQSFRSIREEEVSNFISWISSRARSEINFTEKVHTLMYGITSRAAFGNKSSEQELFVSVMKETAEVVGGFNIADLFPSIGLLQWITGIRSHAERLHQEADKIVENIINEHKKRKAKLKIGKSEEDEDLVDVLLRIQKDGDLELPLTTDNIKAVITDVFGAGSETSATTVDWAMCEMLKNPRVMKKAQAEVREVLFNEKGKVDEMIINEMKFLKLIIKETLRLHPPAPLILPRECSERCEINGFNIPAKAKVIVNEWAIARDPEYWTEPESFIPERFLDCSIDFKGTNFEYLPFGAGRRICPGMTFGLATVELSLAMLLYHFDWKLPNGVNHEDLDMTESFGVTVRRKYDLCVIPIPYHHLHLVE
ncbi:Cytochrome P450 [Melia azedarach]|uniref:Cytochrome P450 n=1 Tax=Melia azedarach TaxID=155640 RepID=A0ACC1YP37_MELAZ|nr:Cytochrome P450 [Melia azedarach]